MTLPVKREILFDKPSPEDEFRGKGHERTADALVRAISQFEGEDRAIGLEGPWGSGKSTVVEIAQAKLKEQKNGFQYHFFSFDI